MYRRYRTEEVIRREKYKENMKMNGQRETEDGKINIFVMKNVDKDVVVVTGVQV